jgi:repressor LexA
MAVNLAYYMKKHGLNQKELAEIAKVSPPTVSYWLQAKKYPKIDRIEVMAAYFGCLKSDLIEEKTEEQRKIEELDRDLTKLLTSLSLSEKRRVLDFIAGIKSSR